MMMKSKCSDRFEPSPEKRGAPPCEELEKVLGYTFRDKGLLQLALTTPSYRADHPDLTRVEDNQRLEFLGDAVFDLLTAQEVYERFTDVKEGVLTQFRSHLASGLAMAEMGRAVNLGAYLLMDKGSEIRGYRNKDKYLADAVEAVFGALWCDGGWPAVKAVYDLMRKDFYSEETTVKAVHTDNPKGRLQEVAQHFGWSDPHYELLSTTGPDHAPVYQIKVSLSTGEAAEGTGRSKRQAEADAARSLLEVLKIDPEQILGKKTRGSTPADSVPPVDKE